jgi:PAS domain S-box-containing protein
MNMTCSAKNPPTIMIVDDKPENLDILSLTLRDCGYSVRPAPNGKLALKAIDEVMPDLILLDVMMPEMDGFEVCRILKANKKTEDIPVIFLTALGRNEDEEKGLSLGAVDYITKPFIIPLIKARVNTHLQLKFHQDNLEDLVKERTIELINANKKLVAEISERKLAEKKIKESEQKFRNLFDFSPVGKSLTEIDGTIHVNRAFCEILGYTEYDMKSIKWMDITHPDDIQLTSKIVESLTEGNISSARCEKRYIHKNGNVVWADVSTFLQRDSDNKIQYFITTINDITARKKNEEDLKESKLNLEKKVSERTVELNKKNKQLDIANKELESFAYTVSHDLRAPLRAIDGFVKILIEDHGSKLNNDAMHICSIISENAHKMGDLIDDLLRFSRIGKTELIPSMIDMRSIVESVFSDLTILEKKSDINFQIKNLYDASGDTDLIRQVWSNLINNAIKFTSKKEVRTIEINSWYEEDEVVYSIRDNGAGFDPKYVSKLFNVFQRLHSSREFDGTGVGLAIVHRIITRHGGKVWAESDLGKGATFYFSLKKETAEG